MTPTDAPPPPAVTPPELDYIIPPAQVILTQPTPECENPDNSGPKAVTINMDEDFHIDLNKTQHQQYQEQFSTSDTESSEHEAPAAEDAGNYAPLVSSPDSPSKTVDASLKDVALEGIDEEIASINTTPQVLDECPTVVVTATTKGDTPTSDDDTEIKAEEEVKPKDNDKPCNDEDKAEEPSATEDKEAENTDPNHFECSFPETDDVDMFQQVPSNIQEADDSVAMKSENGKSGFSDAEQVKMEVNGADSIQNGFTETSNSFETTG